MQVVISAADGEANVWANQFIHRQPAERRGVLVPVHCTAAQATDVIKHGIQLAGRDGTLIFNVGHGAAVQAGFARGWLQGSVELAPNRGMTLGDRNINDSYVNVFYDYQFGGAGSSDQEIDRQLNAGSADAKTRAAHWVVYEALGDAMYLAGIRKVIFLTCNVGNALEFVRKIATDWSVIVEAFKVRVMTQPQVSGRVRMFLEGDSPGVGTNREIGEEEMPLATDFNSTRCGPVP